MRAVILAAGMGRRLDLADGRPKSLLDFAGSTLLARHLTILAAAGIERIEFCLGYRAEMIEAEIARHPARARVVTRRNADFGEGSLLSLWCMREALAAGEPILFMDADVLYDQRMIARLLAAPPGSRYLMDRELEPGDEPVKLCLRGGVLVDLDKKPKLAHDSAGEWIGFARFTPADAARIRAEAERLIGLGARAAPYEDAFRAALIAAPGEFGIVDVSDLPWIEIDFAADLDKARREILPRLLPLPPLSPA